MWKRLLVGAVPFALLFALPFVLRSGRDGEPAFSASDADRLVIVSAHDKSVKREFEQGFRKYYKEKFDRDVELDWRDVGGTSDIIRYIDDRYAANFRDFYRRNFPDEWNDGIAAAFADPRTEKNGTPDQKLARRRFLASDVGINIDLFWGGGSYDHGKNAEKGYGVDGGAADRHPEYFAPDIIPQNFSGEIFYDPAGRFYGCCLSSFGICYNPDRYRELGIEPPKSWDDLGRGELFGLVAVGDPTKSGSVNKCYEMLIQQKMQQSPDAETGWRSAMTLLKRISGNSELVSDSASKIPLEVSSGSAAAGVCIDYYGFAEEEWCNTPDRKRIVFVMPENGSSVGADPIQLLRGAPNRATAEAFIDFVLGVEGQTLWSSKVGVPGGPEKRSPRRPPIRMDMYREPLKQYLIDPEYNPYVTGAGFQYRPELTGRYFALIRILIKCVILDPGDELRAAWRAIIAAGGPEKVPEAWAEFQKLPFSYANAGAMAAELNRTGGPEASEAVAALRREWTQFAREHYLKAADLAAKGR